VDVHLESERSRSLGEVLAPFDGRRLCDGRGTLAWEPTKCDGRGRLRATFAERPTPDVVASAMRELVDLTFDAVDAHIRRGR
jgi:hypothetical protein